MPPTPLKNQGSGQTTQGGKQGVKPTSGYAATVAKNPKARTKATESLRRKDETIDKLGAMLGLPKRTSRKAIVEEATRIISSSPAHIAGVTQSAYRFALSFCDQCVLPSEGASVTVEVLWGNFIYLARLVNPMLAEVLDSPSGIGSPKEVFRWVLVGRLWPHDGDWDVCYDQDGPQQGGGWVISYVPLGSVVDGEAVTTSRFENARFSLGSIDIPSKGIEGLARPRPGLTIGTLSEEDIPQAKRGLFERTVARVVFGSAWER